VSASAVWLLARNLPPFHADPIVFGDHEATEPPYGLLGPVRECRAHEVKWRGDAPCWLCEAVERG
jgi:hypothetical protein